MTAGLLRDIVRILIMRDVVNGRDTVIAVHRRGNIRVVFSTIGVFLILIERKNFLQASRI